MSNPSTLKEQGKMYNKLSQFKKPSISLHASKDHKPMIYKEKLLPSLVNLIYFWNSVSGGMLYGIAS